MDSESTLTIENLPPEVLSKIFSYLKVRHRKNCSLVCKQWMYATRCPSFYRLLKLHKGVFLDEPPLSVFRNSYHPFSVIWFDAIDEFNSNLESLWKEMQESVRELVFSSCDGLEDETLEHMLHNLTEVYKLKIIGSYSLSGNKLDGKFDKITVLDLSDTEFPQMYIEDLVQSFPNLKELNLGSYTYDGWDDSNDYERNSSLTAPNSAFGDWVKALCKLAPKVTLTYDFQIVHRMELMLREFMDAPNLELYSLNLEVKDVPKNVLQQFMVTKGKKLQKLDIPKAHELETFHYELINANCKKLKKLKLLFEDEHQNYILESLPELTLLEKLVIMKPEEKHFELKFTKKPLNFKNMRILSLINCDLESNVTEFEFFLESFPFLTELCLSDCSLSSESLKVIYKTCTKLERIHLNCNEIITDEKLIGDDELSVLNLRCLEAINLNGSKNVTNATISKFSWPELYKLGLREMSEITIEGIRELCKNCSTIEQLDLNGCTKIDDECVLVITQSLPQLEDLDLAGTAATPLALTYIEENCKNIKSVNVSYQPPVSSKAAESLLQRNILHFLTAVVMENLLNSLVIPSVQ